MASDVFVPTVFDELPTDGFVCPAVWKHPRSPRRVTGVDATTSGRSARSGLRAGVLPLTDRDREVLRTLLRLRLCDRHLLQQLFFPSVKTACDRLLYLRRGGYVVAIRQLAARVTDRLIAYRLGSRGAMALAEEQGVTLSEFLYWGKDDDRRRHQTERTHPYVHHARALAYIRVAIEQAAAAMGCTIPEWRDEVEIRREKLYDNVQISPRPDASAISRALVPDGYVVITTGDGQRGHFFLEADMGTESIMQKWQAKVLGYKALFSSGAFHQRYHVAQGVAFRVLVTTPAQTRAQSIKAATERYGDPGLSSLFLLAPLGDVTATNALTTPIWHRGGSTEPQALL